MNAAKVKLLLKSVRGGKNFTAALHLSACGE